MQPPALALNLMISERIEQRHRFAERIKEIVEAENELTNLGQLFKTRLLRHIDNVVANPNCASRTYLFAFADFWNTYFKTRIGTAPLAA